jgi:uncharacterized protein YgiM (DUF1202 family)
MQIVDKTHASKGQGNTRINNEIRISLSRKRITVSMQYIPTHKKSSRENPSEACGIQIEGQDKWKTLIENASKDKKE